MLSNDNTCEPVTSPSASFNAFFDRASLALSSRTSRPDSLATNVAVVVFPAVHQKGRDGDLVHVGQASRLITSTSITKIKRV